LQAVVVFSAIHISIWESVLMRLFLFTMIAMLSSVVVAAESAPRPNVVFIYADDMRWDALGVVQREQGERARFPWLQTPSLDRLAEQGVRFRQSFVVNSLCSPGRACVMTSRYSHLNGIIGNGIPLPMDTVTVATRLKEAGYTTGYCGKWHMDGQRERPGYDFSASFVGQGRYFDCPILLNGKETPTTGWIDDVSTDHAIQFVEKHTSEKPFFLWLGFKSPHGPRGGANLPERVRDLYSDESSREVPNLNSRAIYATVGAEAKQRAKPATNDSHRDYMRHITAIDQCIGRLIAALDKSPHAQRTIVIVTSDNGYYLGEHGLGDKRSAYDESLRVPLLVRMPGEHATGGSVQDAMVLNLDYGPTILDFAAAPALPDAQGRSMRPLLEGKSPADWRTHFLYEYFQERNFNAPTVLALRTTTHKLITYPAHDEWTEVFDLTKDPFEIRNLVGNSELLTELRSKLDEQLKATKFQMPELRTPKNDAPAKLKRKKNRASK
jgi:arylsulfatase A-like enzyme